MQSYAETIIRGSEINFYGKIPFRDRLGGSSDPTSGGWGEIRALVPYELDGSSLTFTSSLGVAIGDLDGSFSYRLLLVEYGASSDSLDSRASVVPVPSAVILGSLGLTFSGWLLKRKRMM